MHEIYLLLFFLLFVFLLLLLCLFFFPTNSFEEEARKCGDPGEGFPKNRIDFEIKE